MLPRRHILDVWEFTKKREELLPMSAVTLAIDAIKHLRPDQERDHLVETLELNEFICYMHPSLRPFNRSLLLHVISDLLGLLLYGMPKKRRSSVESLETIDYSNKNVSYPVIAVWNHLKNRVRSRKVTDEMIIDGFVSKIGIEVDILRHCPFIEDVFRASCGLLDYWVPCLSSFYGVRGDEIVNAYDKWSKGWLSDGDVDKTIDGMIEKLSYQAERDFAIKIDENRVRSSLLNDQETSRKQNEAFSRWYMEGVNMLFEI